MTPPITTYQQLVLVERAAALARAERSRIERDQEDIHIAHIETRTDRQVGLDSLAGRLRRTVSTARRLGTARQPIDGHRSRTRVAPAPR